MKFNMDLGQLKTMFRRHKHVTHRNPTHDWLVILGTTASVFIIVIVIGLFIFSGVVQGTLFVPSDANRSSSVPTLDRVSIDAVTQAYTDKENKVQSLKTTPLQLIDPSN